MNNIHDMWKGYGMVPVFKSLPPPKMFWKKISPSIPIVCAMEVSKIKSDQKKKDDTLSSERVRASVIYGFLAKSAALIVKLHFLSDYIFF